MFCPNFKNPSVKLDFNKLLYNQNQEGLSEEEFNLLMLDKDKFKKILSIEPDKLKAVYVAYNIYNKYEGDIDKFLSIAQLPIVYETLGNLSIDFRIASEEEWNQIINSNEVKELSKKEEFDSKLENKLIDFIKGLNIEVDTNADELLNNLEFNSGNTLAAFDVLQKFLALKSNIGDKVLAKQTANIIYTFLGKKSLLGIEIWKNIKTWSKYKEIYDKYDTYDYKKGYEEQSEDIEYGQSESFNVFAHKQVIIEFISDAILEGYNNKYIGEKRKNPDLDKAYFESKGYKNKYEQNWIKKIYAKIWNWINENIFDNVAVNTYTESQLKDIVLDIVDDVYKKDYTKFIRNYFQNTDGTFSDFKGGDLEPKEYQKTLDKDPFAKKIITDLFNNPFVDYKLSGSQVIRKYGRLVRSISEDLHDIDGVITLNQFEKEQNHKEFRYWAKTRGLELMQTRSQEVFLKEIIPFLKNQSWYSNISNMFPSWKLTTAFIGKDHKNAESITITGYVEHPTEIDTKTGKKKQYILDFFLRTDEGNYPEIFDNYWKDWKQIFEAKLNMGRSKDLNDLIYFIPFKKDKYKFTNKGFRYFSFDESSSKSSRVYRQNKNSNQSIEVITDSLQPITTELESRFNIPTKFITEQEAETQFTRPNSKGFFDFDTQTAYLIENQATIDSTVHEAFSHPFIEVARIQNPELYSNLVTEAIKDKSLVDKIKEDYSNADKIEFEHELIAHSIDKYIKEELDFKKNKGLIAAIKRFFNEMSIALKAIFKKKNIDIKEISPLTTIKDLARFVSYGKGTIDLKSALKNNELILSPKLDVLKLSKEESYQIAEKEFLNSDLQGLELITAINNRADEIYNKGLHSDVKLSDIPHGFVQKLYYLDKDKFDSISQVREELTEQQRGNIQELKQLEPVYAVASDSKVQEFLNSIYPDSKVKEVLFHGTDTKFDKFDKSKTTKKGTKSKTKAIHTSIDFQLAMDYSATNQGYFSASDMYKKVGDEIENLMVVLPVVVNVKNILDSKNLSYNQSKSLEYFDKEQLKLYLEYDEKRSNINVNEYDGFLLNNNEIIVENENQVTILNSPETIQKFQQFISTQSNSIESLSQQIQSNPNSTQSKEFFYWLSQLVSSTSDKTIILNEKSTLKDLYSALKDVTTPFKPFNRIYSQVLSKQERIQAIKDKMAAKNQEKQLSETEIGNLLVKKYNTEQALKKSQNVVEEPLLNNGLNKDQQNASNEIEKFFKSPSSVNKIEDLYNLNNVWFLSGGAGTGKTYLINRLLDNLANEENFTLGISGTTVGIYATSNKAVGEISLANEQYKVSRDSKLNLDPAVTVHDLFGLVYEEGKASTLKNITYGEAAFYKKLSGYKYIIIDELSLANNQLFDLIQERLNLLAEKYDKYKIPKLLFVGDFAQLPSPSGKEIEVEGMSIKQDNKIIDSIYHKYQISKLSGDNNVEKRYSELTINMRAKYDDLFKAAESFKALTIRLNHILLYKLPMQITVNGSPQEDTVQLVRKELTALLNKKQNTPNITYLFSEDENTFIEDYVKLYKQEVFDSKGNIKLNINLRSVAMIGYNNSKHLNNIRITKEIRKRIFGANKEDFNVGELLILNQKDFYPLKDEITNKPPILNLVKEQRVIISSIPRIVEVPTTLKYLTPDLDTMPLYEFEVTTELGEKAIFRIPVNKNLRNVNSFIEFVYETDNGKLYYEVLEHYNFIDTFYGYNITAHSAQGSSYLNNFVSEKNIATNKNLFEKLKLLYVAYSRTVDHLVVLTDISEVMSKKNISNSNASFKQAKIELEKINSELDKRSINIFDANSVIEETTNDIKTNVPILSEEDMNTGRSAKEIGKLMSQLPSTLYSIAVNPKSTSLDDKYIISNKPKLEIERKSSALNNLYISNATQKSKFPNVISFTSIEDINKFQQASKQYGGQLILPKEGVLLPTNSDLKEQVLITLNNRIDPYKTGQFEFIEVGEFARQVMKSKSTLENRTKETLKEQLIEVPKVVEQVTPIEEVVSNVNVEEEVDLEDDYQAEKLRILNNIDLTNLSEEEKANIELAKTNPEIEIMDQNFDLNVEFTTEVPYILIDRKLDIEFETISKTYSEYSIIPKNTKGVLRTLEIPFQKQSRTSDFSTEMYIMKQFIEKLQPLIPGLDIQFVDKSYIRKTFNDERVNWHGWVDDNVVYLNTNKLNLETPAHEITHILLNLIKNQNPELYQQIINLSLERTDIIKDILPNYKNLSPELLGEEVFATLIGENTAKVYVDSNQTNFFTRFNQIVNKFFDEIKKIFSYIFPKQNISKLELNNKTIKSMDLYTLLDLIGDSGIKVDLNSLKTKPIHTFNKKTIEKSMEKLIELDRITNNCF
jgi:hypothetical protein